ncbi:MAG: ATP-binding cassette domain-containing protein, partial [Anaerolineales bacterium]
MIQVEGLSKIFPGAAKGLTITAVDNLSFSVEEGEVFGFLGPNGAGKTNTSPSSTENDKLSTAVMVEPLVAPGKILDKPSTCIMALPRR